MVGEPLLELFETDPWQMYHTIGSTFFALVLLFALRKFLKLYKEKQREIREDKDDYDYLIP